MDDVESWLCVRYQNKHFRLVPADSLGLDTAQRRRAETTLALFKWNENRRLVIERNKAIRRALRAAKRVVQGDQCKAVRVKMLASRFRPYGVAVRQLLQERFPDLIPNPTEELFFLVRHLTKQLSLAQKLLLETPKSAVARRDLSEILWALAVLWKDPPHGSPSEIEHWLERFGCREQVSAVLAHL